MGDINDACEYLADALSVIPGLRARHYFDDQVNPPEVQITNRAYDPRLTMGGSPEREIALVARLFLPRGNLRVAQEQMRDFMDQTGDLSIRATIENSDNWSADIHYAEVEQIGQPFETVGTDTTYLAVDFDVIVVL